MLIFRRIPQDISAAFIQARVSLRHLAYPEMALMRIALDQRTGGPIQHPFRAAMSETGSVALRTANLGL